MRTIAKTSGTNISKRRVMSQEQLKGRVDLGGGDGADRSEADDPPAVDHEDPRFGLELPGLERWGAGLQGRGRRLAVRSRQELLDMDEVGGSGAVLLEHEDLLVGDGAAQPALAEQWRGEAHHGG